MTTVDRIEDLEDTSWIEMITRLNDPYHGWRPKLGVYPVRLAGPKEIKAGLIPHQDRVIEQQLFNSLGWVQVIKAEKMGTFGIHLARQKVLDLHRDRIEKW